MVKLGRSTIFKSCSYLLQATGDSLFSAKSTSFQMGSQQLQDQRIPSGGKVSRWRHDRTGAHNQFRRQNRRGRFHQLTLSFSLNQLV